MVITIVEALVAPDNWIRLEQVFFETIKAGLPPQIMHTFLLRGIADQKQWRIITIWRSQAALEEMRKSTEVPAAIRMFRAAGAEPTVTVFDVRNTSY